MAKPSRGEMYHALRVEDLQAENGREFLVFEISEDTGNEIRALSTDDRHRLQNAVLKCLPPFAAAGPV